MACVIRVCERSGNDVAQFANVAHVDPTHIWIKRESPAQGSVGLLLRSKSAHKALVVHRRDDERMMLKAFFLHDPINLGLAGKVGNVNLPPLMAFPLGSVDQIKCLTPAALAARTAAAACLARRYLLPRNW